MELNETFSGEERRKHRRISLTPLFIEPIQIKFSDSSIKYDFIPGIIVDISSVGMSMITYGDMPPVGSKMVLDFDLIGLKIGNLAGKVFKIRENGGTTLTVMLFDDVQQEVADKLENIAMDFEDCETRWIRGEYDFCESKCGYYSYCSKTIKK